MRSGDMLTSRLWSMAKLAMMSGLALIVAFLMSNGVSQAQSSPTKEVTQVSTGYDTTCAVVNYWPDCWGSNDQGRLGIGNTKQAMASSPVKVANNKNAIPADAGVCKSKNWFGQCTSYSREPAPAKPASAMAGLEVTKVSVGKTHVCAIADARVFCWGDNSRGQLGNRTNSDSAVPVAVDVQTNDVAAVYANPSPCGGWFQPACKPALKEAAKPKSDLGQKEVMDVVAGDHFTCALATDGTVSCWGEGDNGRLGNGAEKDVNYPTQVVSGTADALNNMRGVKLAKVGNASLCVMALPVTSESESVSGQPYCWGLGIGDGSIPQGKGSSETKCSKTSPRSVPSGSSKNTYFDALKPVKMAGSRMMKDISAYDFITGVGTDNKAYYWGMHGHNESTTYTNVKTCVIETCVGVAPTIKLAGYTSNSRTTTQKNSSGGTSKNTNHYSGKATPTTKAKAWKPAYDGCEDRKETRYGFTKTHKFVEIGGITPIAKNTTGALSTVSAASGDAVSGLFCGVTGAGVYCDANGTGMEEGQTGSNYVKQCTTKTTFFIFKSTTCDPAPTVPQKVIAAGWLGSRAVESLSTGGTGFTCALANNSVACWGVNNKGQLGTGDTKNKTVPTQVSGL
jgi:hypothetical protein